MKKSFLFISLDEAKHICDKSQYEEATGWERFKLKLRYIWCRITRNYTERNKSLTHTVQKSNIQCLRPEEISKLRTDFQNHLNDEIQY